MIEPARNYFRLYPGNLVRLRAAYVIRCTGYKLDGSGQVSEVTAEYLPESKGGVAPDGIKVRGTIHWVNQRDCQDAEIRLYDKLFTVPDPDAHDADYKDLINPDSITIISHAKLEPAISTMDSPAGFQFMRLGYFKEDSKLSTAAAPIYNRVVTLKETYRPD